MAGAARLRAVVLGKVNPRRSRSDWSDSSQRGRSTRLRRAIEGRLSEDAKSIVERRQQISDLHGAKVGVRDLCLQLTPRQSWLGDHNSTTKEDGAVRQCPRLMPGDQPEQDAQKGGA